MVGKTVAGPLESPLLAMFFLPQWIGFCCFPISVFIIYTYVQAELEAGHPYWKCFPLNLWMFIPTFKEHLESGPRQEASPDLWLPRPLRPLTLPPSSVYRP